MLVGASLARHVAALSRGDDDRVVERDGESRSISEERTYTEDFFDPRPIDRALLARAAGVARTLRSEGLVARTVHLKVRTGDFTTFTRAQTLREPTDLAEAIVAAARALYADRIDLKGRGVRLLGVGVSGLLDKSEDRPSLFPDAASARARKLAGIEDAVRERAGDRALIRASLMRDKES